mmetsp:Transcript_3776/g.9034  ORF Transcript_3776/g.9034 Transcript_3776/m.9034 type:complete len:586 (+) Transcript_3776:137-1894(+)
MSLKRKTNDDSTTCSDQELLDLIMTVNGLNRGTPVIGTKEYEVSFEWTTAHLAEWTKPVQVPTVFYHLWIACDARRGREQEQLQILEQLQQHGQHRYEEDYYPGRNSIVVWSYVKQVILKHPSIASYCLPYNGKTIAGFSFMQLNCKQGMMLLHLVCSLGPPLDVLDVVIRANPEAIFHKSLGGKLPIMIACQDEFVTPATINLLLQDPKPSSTATATRCNSNSNSNSIKRKKTKMTTPSLSSPSSSSSTLTRINRKERGTLSAISTLTTKDDLGWSASMMCACRRSSPVCVYRALLVLNPSVAKERFGFEAGRHMQYNRRARAAGELGFAWYFFPEPGDNVADCLFKLLRRLEAEYRLNRLTPEHLRARSTFNVDHDNISRKLQLTLQCQHYGTVTSRNGSKSALHAVLAIPVKRNRRPAAVELLQYFVEKDGPQQCGVQDCFGRFPLHYAVKLYRTINSKKGTEHHSSFIEQIVKYFPSGASTMDPSGRLPLHVAIENGHTWSDGGVRALYEAYPKAVSFRDITIKNVDRNRNSSQKDVSNSSSNKGSALYPFALAASSGCDVETIFYLLREYPGVLDDAVTK